MKKVVSVLVVMAFVALTAIPGYAEYDKAAVVKVMAESGAAMGAIKKATEAQDFFAAAQQLMVIATGLKTLEAFTPKKGDKAGWDQNHQSIIDNAFKGIGACGEKDVEKLNAAMGEIGKLIKEGHGLFR